MSTGIGTAGTRDAVLEAVRRLMGPGAAEPCIVDTTARQTGTTAEGHAICEVVCRVLVAKSS